MLIGARNNIPVPIGYLLQTSDGLSVFVGYPGIPFLLQAQDLENVCYNDVGLQLYLLYLFPLSFQFIDILVEERVEGQIKRFPDGFQKMRQMVKGAGDGHVRIGDLL